MAAPIFVDFDNTLTSGDGQPWWVDSFDEHPNEEMIELVNTLFHQNHPIIVYTARTEEVRDETAYYLDKWGVRYHALRMEKPSYRLLIDDRAISDTTALEWGVEGIEGEIYD